MGIVTFKYDNELSDMFIRFPFDLYRNDNGWIPTSKKEMRRQLTPDFTFNSEIKNDHLHILVRKGNRVLGRATAFVNHLLRRNDNPVGTIGFFESIDDLQVAEDLMGTALLWLREQHGIQHVLAPINFDIWHGYRCMTMGFEHTPFLGEPYNKPYYAALFEDSGFTVRKKWHSFDFPITDDTNFLIPGSKKAYDRCLSEGYCFKSFNAKNFDSDFRNLYTMICDSYQRFSAYTPINWKEFQTFYAVLKRITKPDLFTMIKDRTGTYIGFALFIPDEGNFLRFLRRPVRSINNWLLGNRPDHDKKLLFYLIGIIQKEQLSHKGIGKALYYKAINNIYQMGYKAFTVALMAEDSPLYSHAKDQSNKTISEYVLFER